MILTIDTLKKRAALEKLAKVTRDAAEVSVIKVHDVVWQVDDKSRTRMQRTIDTAKRLGLYDTASRDWILADNSTRQTTAAELEAVLDAYTIRMGEIFSQYNSWRTGNKSRPFVVNFTGN